VTRAGPGEDAGGGQESAPRNSGSASNARSTDSCYRRAMSAAADDVLVPRSTGEIITDAVALLRRSIATVFPLVLPFCAVHLVVWELAIHLLTQLASLAQTLATADPVTQASVLPRLLAVVGAFAAGYFVQQLASGVATVVGARLWIGQGCSTGEALGTLAARAAALISSSALFLAGVVGLAGLAALLPLGAGLLAVVNDIGVPAVAGPSLAAAVFVVVSVVLALRWYLFNVVVVTERRSFGDALRRSASLTDGRGLPWGQTPRFRLSVLFVMSLVLTSILQLLFVVPRLVFATITGVDAGAVSLGALPAWLLVPFALLEVATNALVVPFVAYLLCGFTLDLRVRYEAVDEAPRP
jgi:hypothetical protein